jgi:hypothetical protein
MCAELCPKKYAADEHGTTNTISFQPWLCQAARIGKNPSWVAAEVWKQVVDQTAVQFAKKMIMYLS